MNPVCGAIKQSFSRCLSIIGGSGGKVDLSYKSFIKPIYMPLFLNLLVMYLCVSLQSDFVQLLVAF